MIEHTCTAVRLRAERITTTAGAKILSPASDFRKAVRRPTAANGHLPSLPFPPSAAEFPMVRGNTVLVLFQKVLMQYFFKALN